MKKLYFFLAAMLMVSFSFAQIQTKEFRPEPVKKAGMPEFRHSNLSKGAPAAAWLCYLETIYDWAGKEISNDDIVVSRIAMDSNGLTYYTDGDVSHGVFFGFGQTYDFTNQVWDDVLIDGELSIRNTDNYNLDSVVIMAHYNRGALVPAGNVDTLMVAVWTSDPDSNLRQLSINNGATPVVLYYEVLYDVNTHFSQGANIYKLPLTAADCSDTSETGGLYPSEFVLPIHMNNLTDKVLNVTYALKHGYNVPVDDNILDHSYLYGWIGADPRPNYCPYNSTTQSWFTPSDLIFYNQNQGSIISDDNINQTSPGSWYTDGFYPAPLWNSYVQYPYMFIKVSCNDCAIMNVADVEKNNPTVYPNPATNNFTVNLGNDEKANIQLFNIVGQQVYSETITGSAQVNVSNLKSGVYMLKINQNGNVTTTKVVVK